ncbi:MAG: phosphoribosylanthranilate isomerase, partial [Stomatobaculum longum]
AYIADVAAKVLLDVIQLHGSESETVVEEIRQRTGKPVWRAFQVTAPAVLTAAATGADGILLDSGKGSGKTFAWEWLRDFSRPYMLAGGLDTENVGEAIRTLSPRGVDVSSALETDGQKDPEKMRAFAEAVRRADSETER